MARPVKINLISWRDVRLKNIIRKTKYAWPPKKLGHNFLITSTVRIKEAVILAQKLILFFPYIYIIKLYIHTRAGNQKVSVSSRNISNYDFQNIIYLNANFARISLPT